MASTCFPGCAPLTNTRRLQHTLVSLGLLTLAKQRIRRSLAGLDRQGESRHSALIMPLAAQKDKGLSGEIRSFSSALELSVLRLDGNSFSGKLPDLPPSIQEVRLQCNKIHGSVPEGYGELPHLHTLKAESNKLSGSIPTGRDGCSQSHAESMYCCSEGTARSSTLIKSDAVKQHCQHYPALLCGG